MGRKPVAPELKKTSKTLTLNQLQWNKLLALAEKEGFSGPSEFIIAKFKLDK